VSIERRSALRPSCWLRVIDDAIVGIPRSKVNSHFETNGLSPRESH
jgi:hypothetical protein